MRACSGLFLILGVVAVLAFGLDTGQAQGPADALKVGQSPEQVSEKLGTPGRVSRQILLIGCIEQWHYGAPHHVRLTFDCPRGQRPQLQSVRRLPAHGRER